MRIHFIAVGGAVMHNMAIALLKKGNKVSGSDDEIFEPSRSRLDKYGILPEKTGWDPARINSDLDLIILGMHARNDNPELIKALELGLEIKSFPECLYEQTKDKRRIVIGGSHGKTTITSMIMHVLNSTGRKFDYMVGSKVEGFETMVGLNEDADIAIFEGDEYLTSTLDRRPKFHLYKPDIAVISGIAWDHINVFPSFEMYKDQFSIFTQKITPSGTLIYCEEDETVKNIAASTRKDIKLVPYTTHNYTIDERGFTISYMQKDYPLSIFGRHNMQNLSAAKIVCNELGISAKDFYNSISSFRGSARRMQLLLENEKGASYLDFAHSPSKLKATVSALADRYPDHHKVCCFELHTYSSLNSEFLKEYKDCMADADIAYIYYNPNAISHKKLKPLSTENVLKEFGEGVSEVFDDSQNLISSLKKIKSDRIVYLFMSSGDLDGTDFKILSEDLLS
jgi:UDP-N-acetylmuramate: L-alanyl-gamma-D-glutamyl-meso-diaminopimelate ligase